ncbi:M1 family metallopeptidase [Thioalkalivibrio sp. HL-Eb18]|uniref:M1 family metallopeptidase n=1 Tax=Thioalkalivibrio sp. HL-Eb18 TaxID=1266913 RepID=UPI00035E61DF|nr:M1 family aminopeptidase [Thioalkalivibrio sp. HL-Eb18]
MRAAWWISIGLLASLGFVVASAAGNDYAELDSDFPIGLNVHLHPGESSFDGRLVLDLELLDRSPPSRLRLDPAMGIDAVTLDGDSIEYELTESGWLELGDALTKRGTGLLVVEYGARLSQPDQARPGSGFLGEEAGFLPAGAGWYPALEDEPVPMRIQLTVDGGQKAVVSGSLIDDTRVGERYQALYEHPAARHLALASGIWELGVIEGDGWQVRTLFPQSLHEAFGETYREKTAEYIERFESEIGPYPYSSLTVAASPQPVGLAFSGFTLLGEQVIPLPFIPHTSLGHEVLHMWWGTGVYVDRSGGNWSEGLTTYMADYQFKREAGEGREERGQWLRDYAALPADEDRAHGEYQGGNQGALRIAGYHRGAMIWRMLEDWIGREAFLEGARTLYSDWKGREADWNALIAAFDSATDEDLEPFFRQWIERRGAPGLELADLAVDQDENGWTLSGTLRQSGDDKPWDLRVPLVVESEQGSETFWLALAESEKSFVVELDAKPLRVAADPDWRLFRHLAEDESPAILRRAALDPDTQVIALGSARPVEVAPWLGRAAEQSQNVEGTRIVLGEPKSVRDWLRARDWPESPASIDSDLPESPDAAAWAVPGEDVVVIAGPDAQQRRALAGELRHRAHYSYVLLEGDQRSTGHWATPGIWKELQ